MYCRMKVLFVDQTHLKNERELIAMPTNNVSELSMRTIFEHVISDKTDCRKRILLFRVYGTVQINKETCGIAVLLYDP